MVNIKDFVPSPLYHIQHYAKAVPTSTNSVRMESSSFLKAIPVQTLNSVEYGNENKESSSGSGISINASNGSSTDNEYVLVDDTNKDSKNKETLLSVEDRNIFVDVLPNIIRIPWQEEVTKRANNNETSYCCLGISPSQFRRLLSLKENLHCNPSHIAILYAQMAMQYVLKPKKHLPDDNTPMSLVVLIVDSIQKYNFAVFNNKQLKTGTALKYALEEGNRLFDIFTQARARLSPDLIQKVTIIRWNDIYNEKYDTHIRVLQQYMTTSKHFAQLVNDVVQVFINTRKPHGHFTEQKFLCLQEYVLNELPALTHGIVYNGHLYSTIIHPVLSLNDVKNDAQRDVMLRLLNFVRDSSDLRNRFDSIEQVPMCEIFDIVMPASKCLALS